MSLGDLNRHSNHFPDAVAFRPERYLGAAEDTSSWLAFSAGTRRCLGATFAPFELGIVFSRIVQRTGLVAVGPPERSARAGLALAQRRQQPPPPRGPGDSARPTGADSMTAVSPPGPPLPRSLQRLAFNAAQTPFLRACRRRYGDVVGFDRGAGRTVFDPELTRQVLHASPRELAFVGDAEQVIISEHTFVTFAEQDHLEWRRRISRVLTGEQLRSYASVMRDRTDRAIDSWPVGEPFALVGPLQRLMAEIIADLVLGPGGGPRREELLDALMALPRGEASRAQVEELMVDEGRAMDVGDQALTLLLAGAETAADAGLGVRAAPATPRRAQVVAGGGLRQSRAQGEPAPASPRAPRPAPRSRQAVRLGGFVMAPGTLIRASLSQIGDPEFRPERFLEGRDHPPCCSAPARTDAWA